jgi:hypothetical protein
MWQPLLFATEAPAISGIALATHPKSKTAAQAEMLEPP